MSREQNAVVMSDHTIEEVSAYLPSNYNVMELRKGLLMIYGTDHHGWTMQGYVLPRLGSGLIAARELV
jgi:hypothetical protein